MKQDILKKFYNSKEWKIFRENTIANIVKEFGVIKCEQCGNQIVESKFIHLHHKKELTPLNVNDVNIALNPNNIEILCQGCHNKAHGRWCKGQTIKKKEKGVYIIYGAPCSGKTTYVLENMERGDIVVDMDTLYQAVTLLPKYDKPDNLKYNVMAIRNSILDNIKTRYGNFNSAWIVGGYADKYKREQLAKELGAKLIYIQASKEDCLYRLKYCNDYRQEHYEEWKEYIDKWFDRYME